MFIYLVNIVDVCKHHVNYTKRWCTKINKPKSEVEVHLFLIDGKLIYDIKDTLSTKLYLL